LRTNNLTGKQVKQHGGQLTYHISYLLSKYKMQSRTHLHDSAGRNITSGHRYKIRFVGGGAEL
jgi:hypothetical protein